MNFETCFRSSKKSVKNEKWHLLVLFHQVDLAQHLPQALQDLAVTTVPRVGVMTIVNAAIEIAVTTVRLRDTTTGEGIESAQEVREDGGIDHAD
jgi:hypothetical protein